MIISGDDLTRFEMTPEFAAGSTAVAAHAVTLAVGAETLRVFFEEAAWADGFAERYADQLADDPGPAVRHYVTRGGGGYVFWSPGGAAWCFSRGELSTGSVVFLADGTAIGALLSASSTLVSFHAATVVIDGVAGAIAGDSNAGKTTTALACGRAGLQLYSDERCIVAGRVVVPFARSVHVRRDGWERLQRERAGAVPAMARLTSEGFNIRISELFGRFDRTARPELRAVFLLSGAEERARLVPTLWPDVAPSLARWMGSSDRGLQRGVRLIETLRDLACYRLYLGTPGESAKLIRTALTQIAGQRAS